ncbi:sushi domain-containing protein 4-like isoform X4 [Acipenser ruthenus]|uniref:sushi domain-containing protein 4-like isoform X4 n=1 Tax=Acipenser ruthenus TaxID=7906 RepID=UPI00145BDD1E|nr:sushi domain-containing protein 4-like isoform X4 [Acipenser ruthenus]
MHHHVMKCVDPLICPCYRSQSRLLHLILWLHLQLLLLCTADFTVDQQFCIDPGFPEHGNRTPSSGVFFEKAAAHFNCLEGYRLKGSLKMVCIQYQNGSTGWKPSHKPVCLPEVTDCLIPYIEDAEIYNKTYRPGDKLIIICHEGFQIHYPDMDKMVSVCQDDGTWDTLPICQVCPLPPMVEHGDYICHPQPCDRYNHGTVVEFHCDPGYYLANDYKYITCQYGQWFPNLQVYCVKLDLSWPATQENLLTTWKVVAFTATSVLLLLLFVILAKVFQTKFKARCQSRDGQRGPNDPNFVVVAGIPVMLPSYDEAVNSSNFMPPSFPPPAGQGESLHSEDQGPPAYPGYVENSRAIQPESSEYEACESFYDSSEQLQSICPSSMCPGGLNNLSERTNVITSTADTASTSPSIDIADEIPLVEEDC